MKDKKEQGFLEKLFSAKGFFALGVFLILGSLAWMGAHAVIPGTVPAFPLFAAAAGATINLPPTDSGTAVGNIKLDMSVAEADRGKGSDFCANPVAATLNMRGEDVSTGGAVTAGLYHLWQDGLDGSYIGTASNATVMNTKYGIWMTRANYVFKTGEFIVPCGDTTPRPVLSAKQLDTSLTTNTKVFNTVNSTEMPQTNESYALLLAADGGADVEIRLKSSARDLALSGIDDKFGVFINWTNSSTFDWEGQTLDFEGSTCVEDYASPYEPTGSIAGQIVYSAECTGDFKLGIGGKDTSFHVLTVPLKTAQFVDPPQLSKMGVYFIPKMYFLDTTDNEVKLGYATNAKTAVTTAQAITVNIG